MKIDRRKLIGLVIGFLLAANPVSGSLSRQKSQKLTRNKDLPFWLGWYGNMGSPDVPAKVAPKGIDLIMPYVGDSSKESIAIFLEAAKKAKVKVLLEIYRPLVESKNIPEIKKFIRTYKNHPSVCGWYLYDEPEIKTPQPISPDLLIEVYQAIKQEDKTKPVAIAFSEPEKIAPYSDAMDILMWDRYPCNNDLAEYAWVPRYRGLLNQAAQVAKTHKKEFLNILQAYAGHGLKARLPTKGEFRYMFYASVLAGTDGLLFWMYAWATPAWNESVLYPTVKEFRPYLPAITKGKKSKNIIISANKTDVEIKSFPIPNTSKTLVIAINHEKTQSNLTLELDKRFANKKVTSNKKTIDRTSPQADLKVILNPHQVQLYEIG